MCVSKHVCAWFACELLCDAVWVVGLCSLCLFVCVCVLNVCVACNVCFDVVRVVCLLVWFWRVLCVCVFAFDLLNVFGC